MLRYLLRFICCLAALIALQAPVHAGVVGKIVNYKAGNAELVGYIAYDNSIKGKRAGVIVVPDWWGVGDFARDRANALAKMGYTAMVMDVYGNGTYIERPDQAGALMNGFTEDAKAMTARFDATYKTLAKQQTVDKKRMAAIGFSLGGLVVLEMARQGKDLDAVASIWGVVAKAGKPAKKGQVKASVLLQQPAEDGWAPIDAVKNVEQEMKAAGAKVRVIVYPGTVHAFSRPDATQRAEKYKLGIRYDAEADKQSWKDLTAFLAQSTK